MVKRIAKKISIGMVMTVFSVLLLAGNSLAGEVVQVVSQMPVRHYISKSMDKFCERATELSGGELTFQHFPAGQLLKDKEVPKAIKSGTVKVAQTYFAWWAGLVPELKLFGGASYLSPEQYYRFARGPLLEFQNKNLMEKANARILASLLYAEKVGYLLNKPVKNVGDMAGLKVRVSGKYLSAEVTALGGVATVMSSADVYMSLQRGAIQGAHSGLSSFLSRKWYEVAKYVYMPKPMAQDFHLVVNNQWFEGLAPNLQEGIVKAAKEAQELCTKLGAESEAVILEKLKAQGVEVYEVSTEDFVNKIEPILRPKLKAASVELFGQELSDLYDKMVEDSK